jgi:hypothetical protein
MSFDLELAKERVPIPEGVMDSFPPGLIVRGTFEVKSRGEMLAFIQALRGAQEVFPQ